MTPAFLKHIPLKSLLQSAIGLLLPLLAFVLVLVIRYPFPIRPLSIQLRYGFTLVFPALGLLAFLAFRLPARWRTLAGLGLTLIAYGGAVAGLWASGQSEDQALSGLLPWNDSAVYYVDGLRLLEGGRLEVISARRPLLPGLFAVLLGLSGRNLQAAVALLTLIQAAAVYLLVEELRRSDGALAAALAWLILFFFTRRYCGTTTTEALGIALGALGLALLWRWAGSRAGLTLRLSGADAAEAWLGLFALTLASLARPGALLALPAAVLWVGWLQRPSSAQERSTNPAGWRIRLWRGLWPYALGSLVVFAGFLTNSLIFRLLAPPTATPFSNFSYIFYGMAVGGKGWTQYRSDHPEVLTMGEAERSQRVMELALTELRSHPENFLKGTVRQFELLFSESYYSLYSFVTWGNGWISRLVQWSLYALCLLGLFAPLARRAGQRLDARWLLLAVSLVGFFLSVPFAPPMDANRMRVYAANIGLLALLPALGLAFCARWTADRLPVMHWLRRLASRAAVSSPSQNGNLAPADRSSPGLSAVTWSTLVLVGLTILGPLTLRLSARPTRLPAFDCPEHLDALALRFVPGTYINVIREDVLYLDWVPVIHASRFKLWLHNTGNIETIREFETLEPPVTVLVGLNLLNGRRTWLAVDTPLLPVRPGLLGMCGRREPGSMFFKPQTVKWLGEP